MYKCLNNVKKIVHLLSVCFRLRGTDDENKELLERVNSTGKTFLIGTELGGLFVLRFVGGNLMTTMEDVNYVWDIIICELETCS